MSEAKPKRSKSVGGKKKKKRPKTRIGKLKVKEAKLKRDFKSTVNEIKRDSRERQDVESLSVVERQRLANRSTVIRSKILRLKDEIYTRTCVKDDKDSKRIQTKIENRYLAAAKKHNRLLRMTIELEQLEIEEAMIRAMAAGELALDGRELKDGEEESLEGSLADPRKRVANQDLRMNTRELKEEEEDESVEGSLVERRKAMADFSRVSATTLNHTTGDSEETDEKDEHVEQLRESLAELGIVSRREMLEKSERMKRKYELTRELRDLTHSQMISRPARNMYWRINPPYRRKPKEVVHVRKAYAHDFYANRINMEAARNKEMKSPRKEEVEKKKKKESKEELGRVTLASGRTISVKKMKAYAPPGMTLTPIDC